jgi:hypothetical protein
MRKRAIGVVTRDNYMTFAKKYYDNQRPYGLSIAGTETGRLQHIWARREAFFYRVTGDNSYATTAMQFLRGVNLYFTTGPGETTLPLLVWSKVKLGVTPDINALATILVRLGGAHRDGGGFAEAQACFREEVALRERLVVAQPGQRSRLVDLAWARVNLATALLGRAPAAGPSSAADLAAAREVFRVIDLRPIDVPPSDEDVVALLAAYRTLAGRLGTA